jgi:hypothetical protein
MGTQDNKEYLMQRPKQTLALVGIAVVLLGCHAVYWPSFEGDPAPAGVTVTPTPTATEATCAWMWATEDLPDVAALFAAALDAADIAYSSVGASAFGENCFSPNSGEKNYFAAMQTDFSATLPVENAADREAVGNLAADVLAIIVSDFPVESTPGPNAGMITLSFDDNRTTFQVIVQQNQAETLVAQGQRGAALLDELGL